MSGALEDDKRTRPDRFAGPPRAAPVRHAVVVGAGLAGLSAACTLVDAGWRVSVLEARRRAGGATYSFHRSGRAGELEVDNGQHVVLACYSRYRALLDRVGSADRLRWQPRLRIPVLEPGRRSGALSAAALPAPLHAVGALLGYRQLSLRERLSAARAAAALLRLDPADPAVDEVALGPWLREHGQGERAVSRFWSLLCEAALNVGVEQASLALAAMIVRTGFAGRAQDARIGVPTCSLDELHVLPTLRWLDERGVSVLTGAGVKALHRTPTGWLVSGQTGDLSADAVVWATPPAQAARCLPDGALADPQQIAALGSAPIVSAHVLLDRAVLDEPFAAVVDSPLSWIFARDDLLGPGRAGQYLTMPVSAAPRWLELTTAQVRELVLPALRRALPASADVEVLDFFVTRAPHATFHQVAGRGRLRPAAGTTLPGLVLAGSWTATGWPDTIEGAVRSGERAAEVLAATPAPARATDPRPRPTTGPGPRQITDPTTDLPAGQALTPGRRL